MKSLFYYSHLLLVVFFLSCNTNKKEDPNYIRVGVQTGPEYAIAQAAQKVAKERFGLTVELVTFNDYIMPNTALEQGDIHVNAFQTKPFLDAQSEQRGYKFAIAGHTFVYPMAGYSRKINALGELKEGDGIVIPNEISNGSRALLLLEKTGLISLDRKAGNTPRVTDITDNPLKLEIIELEAAQLPRVLDDKKVTVAIINNNFAASAGLLLENSIFAEDKNSIYVNLIVAREENIDDPRIEKFVQAYQSEEVEQTAIREFKGGAIKGWD